ncbi:MAG: hypothetical protein JXL81_00615 [Deltaproteobacteria bacterium]|nr:hypothetical protein [Deltaproteobacteria bacterium]
MDKMNSVYRHRVIPAVLFFTLSLLLINPSGIMAGPDINITVKTISASRKGNSVDPGLKDLVQELQSVFRYSSYEFLGQKDLKLSSNKNGVVPLPEQRVMNISVKGIEGDRVVLEIEILKNNNRIFQTVIKLSNKKSLTIGGPEYKGGNLLFNIFAAF